MTTSALPVGINSRVEKEKSVWNAELAGTSGSWRCLFLWDWSYIRGYWIFFPTVRILISYTSIPKSRWCILLELCTSKHLESCSTFFPKIVVFLFQGVFTLVRLAGSGILYQVHLRRKRTVCLSKDILMSVLWFPFSERSQRKHKRFEK